MGLYGSSQKHPDSGQGKHTKGWKATFFEQLSHDANTQILDFFHFLEDWTVFAGLFFSPSQELSHYGDALLWSHLQDLVSGAACLPKHTRIHHTAGGQGERDTRSRHDR